MWFNSVRINAAYWMIIMAYFMCLSCNRDTGSEPAHSGDTEKEVIIKRRNDGTLSSVNQVVENGVVHGLRVTYYSDGKTVHSKLTFNYGIRNGPSIRYYRNGQIFEHTTYRDGKKHGLTRKYYKNGNVMAEFYHEEGNALPGLKKRENGQESRIYLISENGSAMTQYYVKPGNTIHEKIEIIAEIPTELGNIMVRDLSYDLVVSNEEARPVPY